MEIINEQTDRTIIHKRYEIQIEVGLTIWIGKWIDHDNENSDCDGDWDFVGDIDHETFKNLDQERQDAFDDFVEDIVVNS